MKKSGRRIALLLVTALALFGIVYPGATANAAAATPMAGCSVSYQVTSEWGGGFGADVAVTNLGDAIDGWTLTWAYVPGQTVAQAWNATVTQSGTAVTAKNVGYNPKVATNATVGFGFTGQWTATNPVPATFSLNGQPCDGLVTPCPTTPTSTTGPTAPPASTPPATTVPATTAPATTVPATTAPATTVPATTVPATTKPATPTPTTPAATTPAAAAPTIWMAGDSTMANASTCPIGWGMQFASYFKSGVTVQNKAVAGRSIQTWLYEGNVTSTLAGTDCVISPNTYNARWTAMLDASTGMKSGDYLFIQFGINDGATTCPRHVSTARFQALLTTMIQAAKARGAKPVLLTSTAAITCSGSAAVKNRGFITETTAAATGNSVPLIDLQTLSVNLYNKLGFCPNNSDYTSGIVGAFFCNDHTHFEAAGATQIAGLVATALKNQGIPLSSYLK